jgi:hypothetical protein
VIRKKGHDAKTRLHEALQPGNETGKFFRDTWYPERRGKILTDEKMAWLYDVLYRRLCSAVHSDSAAGKLFAGLHRSHAFTLALQLWAAGLFRLVDTLRLRLPAEQKGILRDYYENLQQ